MFGDSALQLIVRSSSSKAAQAQKADGQCRSASKSEFRERLADSGRELEAVSRKAGRENEVREIRVPVDEEVFVGCHRVEASFGSQNSVERTWQRA